MKHLLTTAGISLLAWLAIAPFQAAEAQHTPQTVAQGSPLEGTPNRPTNDTLGDDPGVDNYEIRGTGENQPDTRRPEVDANRPMNDDGTFLEGTPNRPINDTLGDDPGVDDYEIRGTGENQPGTRRPEVDANRPMNDDGTFLEGTPNRPINDTLGDDPGVDDYEIRGTGETVSPSVDRPRYNRPVTGQNTPQQPYYTNPGTRQPSTNYDTRPGASQSPNNTTSPNYSNEPVRGLW